MDRYTIFHFVPYEGQNSAFCGTLAAVKEWFKTRDPKEYALDDLDIYSDDAPDVYALAAEVANN